MNPLATDWPIKQRSETCNVTQRPFAPGEHFYTLLYREGEGFRREDLSESAWANRNDNIRPFSFWKSRFQPAVAATPEPVARETAEALFRRMISQSDAPVPAVYVLAVMLERKRVLRQTGDELVEERRLLIYEHLRTGDVFIVTDPDLRLNDLERVQADVAQLLEMGSAN